MPPSRYSTGSVKTVASTADSEAASNIVECDHGKLLESKYERDTMSVITLWQAPTTIVVSC